MKKILLTGKEGQIGWELERTLAPLGEVRGFDRIDFDLANHDLMRKILLDFRPDIIVNAAAYTNVDKAETERDLALTINGIAPGILAEEAKHINAILVHYSTDYVYDGKASSPYDENDTPHPINYYGESKLIGERAITTMGGRYLILRTSWVYGTRRKNFMTTMLNQGMEKESLSIVDDQIGSPTWCRLVAEATAQVLCQNLNKKWGIYHLTAAGQTTWYDFAEAIFNQCSHVSKPELKKIPASAYPSPAKRPKYSVLSNAKIAKAFGILLPDWKKGLDLCLGHPHF